MPNRCARLLTCLPVFATATAQTVNHADPGAGLEEVVVAARRTSENLQSTPVAVTALEAEALAQTQVTDVSDLQRNAPGLTVVTGSPAASGTAFAAIRGQGTLNAGVAVDPAVAIYIDGVYIARPSQALVDLVDMQRAEVLRGPQGTLFGRNTTGGAINLFSNDPTGELEGTVRAEAGNYDQRSAGITLNVPLHGEELGARINYSYREHDGFAHNPTLDRDLNDLQSHFARAKLLYAPGDSDWRVSVSGDYSEQRDSGQLVGLSGINTINSALPPPVRAQLLQFQHTHDRWYSSNGTGIPNDPTLPYDLMKAYGASLTVEAPISAVDLKSISAYRYSNASALIDSDATPLAVLANESGYLSRAYSQELQISGTVRERFKWIGGVYYSRETGNEYTRAQSFGFAGLPTFLNDGDVKNISQGVFAQGNYALNDRVRATAGVRWTWDTREVELHNIRNVALPGNATLPNGVPNCAITPDIPGGPCTQREEQKFDYPAWTLGLDFQATDDVFLYAKTSEADKAGGWNLRIGSVPAFDPERVRDVEAGIKTTWLDHRLRVNAALFHSWLNDAQRVVATVQGATTTAYIVNAGDATIYGAELEVTAIPWSGMELNANLSLMDGGYDKGTFTETQIINGAPVVVDRSDEEMLQLPKSQFNVGATQSFRTALGDLSVHADYAYIGAQQFYTGTAGPGSTAAVVEVNALTNELGRTRAYGLINARIALELADTGITVALFGRNLADKQYVTRAFSNLYATPLGIANDFAGDPLTWGISLSYRFSH